MRIATAILGMILSIFGLLALVLVHTTLIIHPTQAWVASMVSVAIALVGVGLMIVLVSMRR